jgi:hypothetical protein
MRALLSTARSFSPERTGERVGSGPAVLAEAGRDIGAALIHYRLCP